MIIGFIGLGNMGFHMARNLALADYRVVGFDIRAACPRGVETGRSAVAVAEAADIVISMLPDGDALISVAEQILPAMKPGSLFLDCSTVDIASARDVAARAQAAGIDFVDAPVSGGVIGAREGTLTFMAGGAESAFRKIKPVLDVMGGRVVHCGEVGLGQAAKLCNNMIVGATMSVTCEAFGLADRLGLDRGKMFDVVSTSSGQSWSMNTYCPAPGVGPSAPSDDDYRPGFAADLMLKDLRLAMQAAKECGAKTPLGRKAAKVYESFVEEEDGSGKDFSALMLKFGGKRD